MKYDAIIALPGATARGGFGCFQSPAEAEMQLTGGPGPAAENIAVNTIKPDLDLGAGTARLRNTVCTHSATTEAVNGLFAL